MPSKAKSKVGIGLNKKGAGLVNDQTSFLAARKSAIAGALNLAGFSADFPMTPLMPANLIDMNTFVAPWRKSGNELFRRCRELAYSGENDFVQGVVGLKDSYFAQGFRVLNEDPKSKKYFTGAEGCVLNGLLQQLSDDIWSEYLACDAAVAFWIRPTASSDAFPLVTILDCEDVQYTNAFGAESLKVTPKKVTLTTAQKQELGPRFADAVGNGKPITLDRDKGECWKVLKRGKAGTGGLGTPKMKAILDLLSQRELLKIGDWAGAWTMKDVIRHIKKGHEIKGGPLQGQPTFFLKNAELNRIRNQMKNKGGAYTAITNWDLFYSFIHLDPKFFDARKYDGVMSMLRAWAGPVMQMAETQNVSPYLMRAFENEGLRERERVARFIESIVNDEDFIGDSDLTVPENIRVGWNPHSFKSLKEITEWVRTASNGQASPQTQRDAMGLDNDTESARMRTAHANLADYTPPFEPRQGMLTKKNGRPSEPDAPPVEE